MTNKIKILYTSNDNWFDGLYLSMLSLLRRTKSIIKFYILTADLSQINEQYLPVSSNHTRILHQLVKSYNEQNEFKLIDCTNIFYKKWNNFNFNEYKISPYSTLRTLICNFSEIYGKIIYLDADTMINNDIKLLNDINIDDFEIAACPDYVWRWRYFKKYFNAGIMLINVDEVKKTGLFDKVIDYIKLNKPTFAEQDAINKCAKKIKPFCKNPFKFNYQYANIRNDTVIKHFVSGIHINPKKYKIRQWDIDKVQNWLKIHNWDDDYAIYQKEKIKWSK